MWSSINSFKKSMRSFSSSLSRFTSTEHLRKLLLIQVRKFTSMFGLSCAFSRPRITCLCFTTTYKPRCLRPLVVAFAGHAFNLGTSPSMKRKSSDMENDVNFRIASKMLKDNSFPVFPGWFLLPCRWKNYLLIHSCWISCDYYFVHDTIRFLFRWCFVHWLDGTYYCILNRRAEIIPSHALESKGKGKELETWSS